MRLIHIHSPNIRMNMHLEEKDLKPVFDIGYFEQGEMKQHQAHKVQLTHEGKLIATFHYNKKSPLASGAHVWIETEECCNLVIDDKEISMADPMCNKCKKKHHSCRYSCLFPDEICESVCDPCQREKIIKEANKRRRK